MKHLIAAIAIRLLGGRLAANEDAPAALLANASDGGSPFAILQEDGFVIPYGQYPHPKGLQLFDQAAANDLITAHNSVLSRMSRFLRGDGASYPVYVGHPDLPSSKDTDKRAYGWIESMSAENDGLHMKVKWSPAGRELVENAHYKYYSPLWYFRKVQGGIRPVALKSMGLTNDPNIPVPALANEYEEGADSKMKPEGEATETETETETETTTETETETETPPVPAPAEIIAILGMGEDATIEMALEKIRQLVDAQTENTRKVTEAENERDTAATRATDLESRLRLAAANAVQSAVTSGRILPAESEAKINELCAANDLSAALADLVKLPTKFKTSSATGDLGGARAIVVLAANDEAKQAKEERARLVANEFENTNPQLSIGERKRIAWRKAQAKKPELFTKGSSGSAA